MNSEQELTVVVVHWRKPDWCEETIESLLRSDAIRVKVVVVDNEATLGAAATRIAEHLDVTVLAQPENAGYAGGANVGLSWWAANEPAAEFVAVASHDVEVAPASLAALVESLASDPQLGVVAPTLKAPRVGVGVWRGWRARTDALEEPSDPASPMLCDWVSGTLLVTRRDVLAEIGGFDSRFGSYVEDVDLGLRARDAGWLVAVLPSAPARQRGSGSALVTRLVDWNSLLLVAKRRGLRWIIPVLLRYAWWVPRGLVAAGVLTRPKERRTASIQHARDHAWVLGRVARDWGQLREASRVPDGRTPQVVPDRISSS